MRILIVDDSNSITMVVSQMLKEAGHEPLRAVDGKDAIDVLGKEENIDLILLDWNMPNMSGIEFLQYNAENKVAACPIIMMTTENKPDNIRKALELGVSEYIMKPFTQDILVSKINSVVGTAAA